MLYTFKQVEEPVWEFDEKQISLILTRTALEAKKIFDLVQVNGLNQKSIYYFPTWETLPYDRYSPSANIRAQRLDVLYRMRNADKGVIITSIDAICSKLAPPSYLDANAFIVSIGDRIPITSLVERLSQAGYSRVEKVVEKGQFSSRGAVLDLFPPSSKFPIRLDYLDDEVEQIRVFDVRTQLSVSKIDKVYLIPSTEFDLSDHGKTCFRQSMRQVLKDKAESNPIYNRLSEKKAVSGLEYFLPMFFDETASFLDYLPQKKNITFYKSEGINHYIKKYWKYIDQRYDSVSRQSDIYLPPNKIYFSINALTDQLEKFSSSYQKNNEIEPSVIIKTIKLFDSPEKNLAKLINVIKKFQVSVYIFCKTEGEKRLLLEKLDKAILSNLIQIDYFDWKKQLIMNKVQCAIGVGHWSQPVSITHPQYRGIIYTASNLLSRLEPPEDLEKTINPLQIIESLSQISIGTPVVHKDHGVGRYAGLDVITIEDDTSEYIVIKYANDGKLYIPVTSLDLITRYTGASEENAPLHNLNGNQWQKAKEKAQKKIYDTAAELLEIYAKRAQAKNEGIKIDKESLSIFVEKFPFKPTHDQTKAFNAVYKDLQQNKPMDRIICGDVGFGKTEVALRAAFTMALSGKQVALLVPTTLLAEQHLKHFKERFSDFSIVVEGLSRFKTAKEQMTVLSQLSEGKIDIVIGTHRLIQKDVHFENLGLVIVDEEHKFGVKQKEMMKKLRSDINILTLTATPIPRTLSMSLSGLRDLSIIASPPAKRSPVETIFSGFDEEMIREGVSRETSRGGQIYFVHNEIDTMGTVESLLKQWFPSLSIQYAHGQMPESQLENIMKRFYEQHFDILLATTIIESGIDNPNANTIFINRADKFGLAQLHQLRGRVGRSVHQAYAYLMTPPESIISSDATKRLEAFSRLKGLGVGFMLASHDMEIRGAGEILGGNQSGQIIEIGFSLFNSLLEETVDAMKNNREVDYNQSHTNLEIDLGFSALIPEDYIFDVHTRLTLYKRLSSCVNNDQIDQLYIECIDRFGLIPEPMKVLFAVFRVKVRVYQMGIDRLLVDDKLMRLVLSKNHVVKSEKLIELIQKNPIKYQLKSPLQLNIKIKAKTREEREACIHQLLDLIS